MKTMPYVLALSLWIMWSDISVGLPDSGTHAASVLGQANALVEKASSREDMREAISKYEEVLRIFEKSDSPRQQGAVLNNIAVVYNMWGQYGKALEYYERSLEKRRIVGDREGEGITLNNIGLVYDAMGEYAKALDYYEKSIELTRKTGDRKQEAATLNNIASVYDSYGQYSRALENFQAALNIMGEIGDETGQGYTLSDIGRVYQSRGQYQKAQEYYKKSLALMRKTGNAHGQANTLAGLGKLNANMGNFSEAEKSLDQAITIFEKLGAPTLSVEDDLANLYLDTGDLNKAETLLKKTGNDLSLGRLALIRSDFKNAQAYYLKGLSMSEKSGDSDSLFRSYTGLAKSCEGLENYIKAEEYYEKAMNHTESIRSGLLPSERKNFFEVRSGGFERSEPARGLTRVRLKLNRSTDSITPSELTRARSFSDHLAQRSSSGVSGISTETVAREQSLVNKLAALKKELTRTDRQRQSARYESISQQVNKAQSELDSFVETLRSEYPAYAAIKYPQPVTLKESSLKMDEYVLIFDISSEGVGVKLIKDKSIVETFFKKYDSNELERDVRRFREPFENRRLGGFDPELGKSLYRKLLHRALDDVPKGTPLIIIPDGILALLPFEALVTGGKANWKKVDTKWPDQFRDYPEGLTFLGDDYPVSYYQSITALTLARSSWNNKKVDDKLLVVADPVFELQDDRAQGVPQSKIDEPQKRNNIELMATIEGASNGRFNFGRLSETGILASKLKKMYGTDCVALTGFNANKSDFLSKIAPKIDQYGNVIFATHGVMSTHVPGLMEPFLALTMAPPGTDGFLKMSDILSLKMNADVVALTACQTGLGKDLSGEGVMSMGRAFQYAGAKSVLMTLWAVEEKSAVTLAELFFKYRKSGKTKLDALKAARDDIRNQGYKHPFFWAAFILVGETS